MNLPIPRHRREDPEHEHERLHASLVQDLERWPHFASDLIDSVRDVVPLADVEESDDSYLVELDTASLDHGVLAVRVPKAEHAGVVGSPSG